MDVSHARDSNMSEIESIRTRLHDSYIQLIKAMKVIVFLIHLIHRLMLIHVV